MDATERPAATGHVMNEKSARTLELPKILERLAGFTSFSASAELARNLRPTPYLDDAIEWQETTTEARLLLGSREAISIGGARDVRPAAMSATRGITLEPATLLDIRATLRQATTLRRLLGRMHGQFPRLAAISDRLEECTSLQHEIARVLDETGQVQDNASVKLATVRRELRIAFDRLQSKLNNIIHSADNAKYLQEALITQRHGRYVIPLKAEFKGRIQGIVHDQSSSGATLFIEPLATVELNNAWRELQLEEENEIRRILRELSEMVGHEARYIIRTVETLAELDLIFARAKYADALNANPVELVGFRKAPYPHPGSTIRLLSARHPLLDPKTVVPIDVDIDEETYVLVITGPNTGGKTVALKTVGLLTLMAQCGMHLPVAPGSRLTVFEDVFADIGDEQSIEQSLSTFSSHMKQIIEILDVANERTLVILDELGAGTDPAEGSALARALLDDLVERGITTLVTTHHPELKIYSHEKKGVRNASVEFDLETLRPTYRLIVGLPGRSNALAIAERLGLPKSIVEKARSLVTEEDLIADDLLDEIHKTREETRRAHDEALRAQAHAEEIRNSLRERLEAIEQERREVLAQSRQEAAAELEELRTEIRRIRKQLAAAGQPLEAIRRVTDEVKSLEGEISEMPAPAVEMPEDVDDTRTLRLGDIVWVQSLGVEGQILELGEEDAEVQVGRLRLRAKLDDLAYRSKSESKRDKKKRTARADGGSGTATSAPRAPSPGLELDLRGQTVEDSIPLLEDYLDAAYMAGLPFVRIIHGKGTGVLRQAVRERLNGHPLVKKYARGDEKEGGDGVTVVSLVPSS